MVSRSSNTDVKLADFGTARVMGAQHLASTFSGTRYTMAPEVLRCDDMNMDRLSLNDTTTTSRQKYDGRFADVYSCGVVLYTILKASYPKNEMDVKACCENMTSRGNRLLLKLMDSNPIHRPTANDALRWISSSASEPSSPPGLPPGLKKSSNKKPRQRHKTPPRSALKAMKNRAMTDESCIVDEKNSDGDEGMCCVQ